MLKDFEFFTLSCVININIKLYLAPQTPAEMLIQMQNSAWKSLQTRTLSSGLPYGEEAIVNKFGELCIEFMTCIS